MTIRMTALTMFAIVVLAPRSAAEEKFASPGAAFAAAKKAAEASDAKAFLGCLSDDSQRVMAGSVIGMLATMPQAALKQAPKTTREMVAKLRAAAQANGVTQIQLDNVNKAKLMQVMSGQADDGKQFLADLANPLKNRTAFLMAVMKASPGGQFRKFAEADLSDLKIDGKKATGKLKVGPVTGQPIDFIKTAKGWRMELGGAMAGPAR